MDAQGGLQRRDPVGKLSGDTGAQVPHGVGGDQGGGRGHVQVVDEPVERCADVLDDQLVLVQVLFGGVQQMVGPLLVLHAAARQ